MTLIWLYLLQDWWRTVNEISNFLHTGEIENFIFPLWPAQLMAMLVQTCPAQWGDLKLVQHLGGQPFFQELEV